MFGAGYEKMDSPRHSTRTIAEWVTIVYRVVQMLFGIYVFVNAWNFVPELAAAADLNVEELETWADKAMELASGRELFEAFMIFGRIEHTCWAACSCFGMAYTFVIPFKDAHPAFFVLAMMWTLAALTHVQALLMPTKFLYAIDTNYTLIFVDPVFAALGWFSFYASKRQL